MLNVDLQHLPWMAMRVEFVQPEKQLGGFDVEKLTKAATGAEIFSTGLPLNRNHFDTDALIESLETNHQVEIEPFYNSTPLGITMIVSIENVPAISKDLEPIWGKNIRRDVLVFRKK